MRNSILSMALAVTGSLLVAGLLTGPHAADRETLATMAKGTAVNATNGNQYVVLPGALAAPAEDKNEEPELALKRAGATGKQVLERKGPFVIYRANLAPAAQSTAAPKVAMQASGNPVLLNTETGDLAVVTGNLRVKLNSGSPTDVAAAHGLTVAHDFPRLRVAYLSAPNGTDLLAAMNALRADPRVAEADLEVMEHERKAF